MTDPASPSRRGGPGTARGWAKRFSDASPAGESHGGIKVQTVVDSISANPSLDQMRPSGARKATGPGPGEPSTH